MNSVVGRRPLYDMASMARCFRLSRLASISPLINNSRLPSQKWRSNAFASSNPAASNTEEASKGPENVSDETAQTTTHGGVDMNELTKQKNELEEKLKTVEDKYKRALAETENVRQRMQRQIQDAKLFGIQGFCKDLLDVADILQRATTTIPADELSDKNPHLKSLHEGLIMTETQLQKVFRQHGLEQINPIGEKFNPNMHEALFEQVVAGKEPGTVAIVTKIGYKLHERTIRPALVGVVKSS